MQDFMGSIQPGLIQENGFMTSKFMEHIVRKEKLENLIHIFKAKKAERLSE